MVVGSPVVVVAVSYICRTERAVEVCCSGWVEMFGEFFLWVGMGSDLSSGPDDGIVPWT